MQKLLRFLPIDWRVYLHRKFNFPRTPTICHEAILIGVYESGRFNCTAYGTLPPHDCRHGQFPFSADDTESLAAGWLERGFHQVAVVDLTGAPEKWPAPEIFTQEASRAA